MTQNQDMDRGAYHDAGASELTMPIGEAMFTQRSIRRMREDPVPVEQLRLVVAAAAKAPNGGNRQICRLLVATDKDKIAAFGELYRRSWWAKRKEDRGWNGPEDVPPGDTSMAPAMRLADYGEFRAIFGVPEDIGFHLAIPLGYPQGRFGPTTRLPTAETTHWNQWGAAVPWA